MMNDDSMQTIEDQLRALAPRQLDLDAEAILAAARSGDVDGVTAPHTLAWGFRHALPLAAACVVGMLVGSTLTAWLMHSAEGRAAVEPSLVNPADDVAPVNRDVMESDTNSRPVTSEPEAVDFADSGDAARQAVGPVASEYPTLHRNGLTYSPQQQRFLSVTQVTGSMDNADGDTFPAGNAAESNGESAPDTPTTPLRRRHRLMNDLLRM